MNLARAVQVSIDTAVQPCKDRKVSNWGAEHAPQCGWWAVVVHQWLRWVLWVIWGFWGHAVVIIHGRSRWARHVVMGPSSTLFATPPCHTCALQCGSDSQGGPWLVIVAVATQAVSVMWVLRALVGVQEEGWVRMGHESVFFLPYPLIK